MSTLLKKVRKRGVALFCAICVSASLWATAGLSNVAQTDSSTLQRSGSTITPYLDRMAEAVTEFTLDNGMTFIVQAQHQAPIVSTTIYADVGAANEASGQTGLAHYLEHLLFMGTHEIGTTDYEAEAGVLAQLDDTFDQLQVAEAAGDETEVVALRSQFEQLQVEADAYMIPEQYSEILEGAGARNVNATTSKDATWYHYDLPANKLELWFSLESDRFANPVFRRFYEEKLVVQEENLSYSNHPVRRLIEAFDRAAYDAEHPYHHSIGGAGALEDVHQSTRAEVMDFYNTYYDPSNLTAVLVGDVDPQQVQQWAQLYFGNMRSQGEVPDLVEQLPNRTASRSYSISMASEPIYIEGYHRAGLNSPAYTVHRAICSLLTEGPTSRLYKALVDQQLATEVRCYTDSTQKVAALTQLMAFPLPNRTDEVAAVIADELQRLQASPVEQDELNALKARLRTSMLMSLASKGELATILAQHKVVTGDWQNAFQDVKDVETIDAADIQRVARSLFTSENKTVGTIVPVEEDISVEDS